MKRQMIPLVKKMVFAFCLLSGLLFAATANAQQGRHPSYLHALEDLRAARWMIEHKTGNWQQSMFEHDATREIEAAIHEIKQAAIDDGKNVEDHPKVDERPDRMGRLRGALDFLKKAREDISHEEDNRFANGLRDRAYRHIDMAIESVHKAMEAR